MLKRFILRAVTNTAAFYIVDVFMDSVKVVGGMKAIVVVGLIFTISNMIVKPILKIISLPIMFITGGLFIVVINTFILYMSTKLLPIIDKTLSLNIEGIKMYFIATVFLSIITWLEWLFLKPRKKHEDNNE